MNAIVYIVETLMSLALFVVLARLLLQLTRADFRNPIAQAIVQLTNPLIVPLRRVLPPIGKVDTASVVAVRPALLSFLSRAAFDEFANRHPDVYKSLVTVIAARLRETDATVAAGSFLPLRGRVACTLLELAQDFGQDVGAGRIVIRQKIGQSDLAAMAGIARENVSRILNDWKRRKLVSRLSGYYCLENKALLQNEAEL